MGEVAEQSEVGGGTYFSWKSRFSEYLRSKYSDSPRPSGTPLINEGGKILDLRLFQYDPRTAISISGFGDDDLLFDALLELRHMGDDAHQPPSVGQARQGVHGHAQTLLVQRAEALIHEHGVQLDAAGLGLDQVRQAQGQGQGGLEALAAGEGIDTADRAGAR